MARKVEEPVYSKVSLDDVEGLEGCTVTVWANFPLRILNQLDSGTPATMTTFLVDVIKGWEGFEMPLNRKSIAELTMSEARAIVPKIIEHVANPQMRNKVTL